MKTKILSTLIGLACASNAAVGRTASQRTYAHVVFHLCPEAMPDGCANTIEIANKRYLFEGSNSGAIESLKTAIARARANGRDYTKPMNVKAYFIVKAGMWPNIKESHDVAEIASLSSTGPSTRTVSIK